MPITPTYPGVYIEEIPSGVRTIAGVATSLAAFLDFFPRGPLNSAVQLFSYADFEREFGGLDIRSEASYAIQQFFLNGGTEAFAIRVASGSFATASVIISAGGDQIFRATAGRRLRGVSVNNPGAWANGLRLEVDYDTSTPDEYFNLIVTETAQQDGRTVVRQTETFRNLTMRPNVANNAIEVVNEGSRLVQLDRSGLAPASVPDPFVTSFRPDATGTLGGTVPTPATLPSDNDELAIALNPGGGAPVVNLTTRIRYGGASPADYAAVRSYVEAAIRAADVNQPLLTGAAVQFSNNRFRVLLGRGGANFQPDATITLTDGVTGTPATDLALTVATGATVRVQQIAFTTAGADGDRPDATALRGARAAKTGLYALEDVDLFNILCIPRAAELSATDMRAVYAEAESYCLERRAFLIVDIPATVNELDEMQTWLSQNDSLRHQNAAVYFPRPRIADPLNQNRLRSVGASGTMAGLYAHSDSARGVWKAPAGTEARLRNVQELDDVLTDRENGALNPLGVNCLRTFPVYGNVCWGARTLDGADALASDWKYIPVRRLALFLEESLYRGTKWVVFEPNDEPLWAQIRLNIGAFMQRLFRQGAFQGQTPREAYFVKCDKETTTQADINLGIVNIVVGFAPLKPAEFVIIRIQQMAGQIPT